MRFDVLAAASVLVDDIDAAVEVLNSAIGLPRPNPRWQEESEGVRAMFCRVHPSYAVAPTRLELVSSVPDSSYSYGPTGFPVAEVAARQGDRRIKLHSTPVGMPNDELHEVGERLWDLSLAHGYLGPPSRTRVMMAPVGPFGNTAADGSLFIEVLPTEQLDLPAEALYAPADVPPDVRPADMVRIVAREYLVEDLDHALSELRLALHWEPSSVEDAGECRRAVMPFRAARSARIELVEPARRGRVRAAFDDLGPGAWTVRIAVRDLEAKAEDLEARGTAFSREAGVLRPDPERTLAVPFEFVPAT